MTNAADFDDDQFDTETAPLGDDEYEDDPSGVEAGAPEAELTDDEKAWAQGWRPNVRGKNGVSLTAAEFLARGVQEHSILRHNNEKMTDRLARMERRQEESDRVIAQQAQAIKDGIALAQRASDAGYQRALNELKSQQRAAAATGDVETFDHVDQQIAAMETERAKTPAPTAPAAPAPQSVTDPVIRDFLAAPPAWFQNPEMRAALITAQSNLVKANPGVAEGDLLDEAIEEVAAIFPGRIRNRGAPPVPPRERQTPDPAPRERAAPRRPAGVLTPGAGGGGRPPAPRDPFARLAETDRAEARETFQRQAPWGESDPVKYVALRLGERSAADVANDTRAARLAARK